MVQGISRTRVLRIVVVLTVMVIGATAGGFYIYYASNDGGAETATADQAATDQTQADDKTDEAAAGEDSEDGEDEETAIPVSVAAVEIGSVSTYITATSNLVPEDEVKVLAEWHPPCSIFRSWRSSRHNSQLSVPRYSARMVRI